MKTMLNQIYDSQKLYYLSAFNTDVHLVTYSRSDI